MTYFVQIVFRQKILILTIYFLKNYNFDEMLITISIHGYFVNVKTQNLG